MAEAFLEQLDLTQQQTKGPINIEDPTLKGTFMKPPEYDEKSHNSESDYPQSDITDLETDDQTPFSEYLSPRQRSKRKRMTSKNNHDDVMNNTITNTPKDSNVVIIHATNAVKLALKNPITIQKLIQNASGSPVSDIKPLRNGDLLVKCLDRPHMNQLLELKKLGDFPVNCKIPISETSSVGVIYGVCPDLTDEEIKNEISSQGVKTFYHLKSKNYTGTNTRPTTLKLIFLSKELPKYVQIGFKKYRIKPFIPPPIRCYNCNRWGHISKDCKGHKKCVKCGENHDRSECENEPKCGNCGEKHSAAYKGCIKRKEAIKINEIRSTERISRSKAVEILKSYASVTEGNYKMNEHQTEQRTHNSQTARRKQIPRKNNTAPQNLSQRILQNNIQKQLDQQKSDGEPTTTIKVKNVAYFISSIFITLATNTMSKQQILDLICRKAEKHLQIPITVEEIVDEI